MKIKIIFVLFAIFTLVSAKSAFADNCTESCNGNAECIRQCTSTQVRSNDDQRIPIPSEWLSIIPVEGIPVGDVDYVKATLVPFIVNVLLFLVMVGSLVMLIVGGVMWITGGGDKEATTKAKATVTYAIMGLVLGLSSFLIVNTIFYFLGIDIPK